MKAFTLDDVQIRQDGYIGPYGWYWQPSAIASIVLRAFLDTRPSYIDARDLKEVTVYVSELFTHDAGALSAGCHDTLHSVFVKVSSGHGMPTQDQVYNAYRNTNAQFNVEAIRGGYHFYKTW